jgi:hypothetical protein
MRIRFLVTVLFLLSTFVFTEAAKAEILGDFLGYTACMACHKDTVDGWRTTPHGHAFATLKTQGVEKQSNPGCVKCHVVGYNLDGGYIDEDLTPELKDVQCESCHGPGRAHVESEGDADLILAAPDEGTCRACHTPGQDKNFNYKTKSRLVHGNR